MFSIVEFINAVFCCVDDLLKDITLDRAIRPHGVLPTLAESEVHDKNCGRVWLYCFQYVNVYCEHLHTENNRAQNIRVLM
jgi:hypothetical protein